MKRRSFFHVILGVLGISTFAEHQSSRVFQCTGQQWIPPSVRDCDPTAVWKKANYYVSGRIVLNRQYLKELEEGYQRTLTLNDYRAIIQGKDRLFDEIKLRVEKQTRLDA
jgi:hypothetical protein